MQRPISIEPAGIVGDTYASMDVAVVHQINTAHVDGPLDGTLDVHGRRTPQRERETEREHMEKQGQRDTETEEQRDRHTKTQRQ